jgi:hypothetical protein
MKNPHWNIQMLMVWTLLDSILSPQQHCLIGHSQEIQPKPYFGQHQETKTL